MELNWIDRRDGLSCELKSAIFRTPNLKLTVADVELLKLYLPYEQAKRIELNRSRICARHNFIRVIIENQFISQYLKFVLIMLPTQGKRPDGNRLATPSARDFGFNITAYKLEICRP